ncbi:release factor glutamine methyltransferase [Planifilum fulgidum]|uniref:Release factor glutamine methyltransferase n=1 Tax=Planifilum fulgidum TaxID=201973 RepID=A0A1I2LK27_9BACL|nr:peptide chain release factor N(5)-glutamine methyltransferase [Planifilum fulgidum]MBO2496547.1 peptide chain release factor N(5)-glutamine methyltransferase [Bacillota bacterium]MBO2531376.1 peptide chain release factor N(5)-glutamine methyltransferase [Thermoactinomycetaceae bacterium]SFF79644.1 release factor glutamine methyltransferase [Planifilum fulgidum]
METKPLKTVGEAYRWAFSFLQKRGCDQALFEAELLLRHLLGRDRTRFFAGMEDPFPEDRLPTFRKWLNRRAAGEPVQYILREQEFYGRPFKVTPAVLIPRPETEILAENVMREADRIGGGRPLSVCDVGTGSGALAVTLAAERPRWVVFATDISSAALAVARENARRNGVEERIRFLRGKWLEPLRQGGDRVDVVVSNPPYIPSKEIAALKREVRDFEPRLALDGGEDGLDAYRRIIEQIPDVLRLPGLVAFEVGMGQSRHVAGMLESMPLSVSVSIVPDLAGIERVVLGRIGPRGL